MTSQPKRRWQFGLRDLAWLTLAVALGAGWCVDRRASLNREAEAEARVDELSRDNENLIDMNKTQVNRAQRSYTEWMAAEDENHRLKAMLDAAP